MTVDAKVRDIVVPVFVARWNDSTFDYKSSHGTAFLIGKRGFAITAAHVIEQVSDEDGEGVLGFIDDDNSWIGGRIIEYEKHPSEDIAILKLDGRKPRQSWLVLSGNSRFQSCKYDCWGYPIDIAEFSRKFGEEQLESPDLIYTHGYVRRRISKPFPFSLYRGSSFYELSEDGGSGCSGAPVIDVTSIGKGSWDVFGVYIGHATIGECEASYAVRSDAICDWHPTILGRSLRDECLY